MSEYIIIGKRSCKSIMTVYCFFLVLMVQSVSAQEGYLRSPDEPPGSPEKPVSHSANPDGVFNHELKSESGKKPLFALKTNLLFDLATALNIEIEVPVRDRWSIAGECIFPWWLWENKQYCLQTLTGNLEGRYWLGDRTGRKQLTGWFAGVYGCGGYYDIEWKDKGYQGYFFSVGLTGGYAHSISKNLHMEYSFGLGYANSAYDKYFPVRGTDDKWHLIREKSDRRIWGGPTKVKVSLVWVLNHRFWKKGGSK